MNDQSPLNVELTLLRNEVASLRDRLSELGTSFDALSDDVIQNASLNKLRIWRRDLDHHIRTLSSGGG